MMDTNPYEYDTAVPWIPQQEQSYRNSFVTSRTHQQFSEEQSLQQRGQKLKTPERMSKAETMELIRTFKKWLIIASLVCFGAFSGLAAYHQAAATSPTSPTDPTQASPLTPPSSGGFFDQQGGNNFGQSHSWQGPVGGSSVS